jgi:glycosyltransferase involved in cell wall biosynthesis
MLGFFDLHGYVQDVIPYYKECDAQVVASTDALGLRTRIVESFAFGLPVVSTFVAAEGLRGFVPGKHLLIADTADEFVEKLTNLANSPNRLAQLSRDCRAFYIRHQSRAAVASELSVFLNKHLPHGNTNSKQTD